MNACVRVHARVRTHTHARTCSHAQREPPVPNFLTEYFSPWSENKPLLKQYGDLPGKTHLQRFILCHRRKWVEKRGV